MNVENSISKTKNTLIIIAEESDFSEELKYLKENFCGTVLMGNPQSSAGLEGQKLYVCGDISGLGKLSQPIHIIEELSEHIDSYSGSAMQVVGLGQVPISVHDAGVYYRQLFVDDKDYFQRIKSEHAFQELTESTKASKAGR